MYCIRLITENKRSYLPLLLIADPSEAMIDRYLDRGALYVLSERGEDVAAAVVTMEEAGVCELKNLVTAEPSRKQGYAALLLEYLFFKYAAAFSRMRVGTGEPLVPFYERFGFARAGRIEDFFVTNYGAPVDDDGILLTDMVLLERPLKPGCPCEDEAGRTD